MKKIKLLLLPFVLLLTFVLSCQKDMDEAFDLPQVQDNLKGSNLRQTYEKRFKNDSLLTALKIEPIWNTSVEFEHAIEVAFKTDGKLSFPSSKKGLKGGGRERLLLLEKPQGGYSIIKVRYKPSEDFKKDLKKINTGNFTKEQFDGIITLEELSSGKMKVMELSQGKLLKSRMRYKSSRNNNLRVKDDCVLIECFAEDTNWYQWSNASGEWYYTNTNTEYYCEYTYLGECGNVDPNNGEDPYGCDVNPNSPWCNGGGGSSTFGSTALSAGDRPLAIFSSKCDGLSDLWSRSISSGKEVNGVITLDGTFLVTQVSGILGGEFKGVYGYQGTLYYYFPVDGGAAPTFQGTIVSGGKYYIPIKATIHSHTPCVNDGTDGVTGNHSSDDVFFANKFPEASHYVLGCGAIGQFSGTSYGYFNIHTGTISQMCTTLP
ncbi:hypothetical protein GVN16_19240 [Emticicia sp. CRIBPO]|uniref:hypothetical protein n=1 Tax=Emticicia sp. CRIBPO TaxID=2683258 RepID=UPI001411E1D7|nr:hypothetical protein [Emticicia sp. CRIBPO]NBA87913.1 hypothetical protein [Emticicia sp. CRIBPO]